MPWAALECNFDFLKGFERTFPKNLLLLLYQLPYGLLVGLSWRPACILTRATKNVRKAVAAVIVSAMLAATNCQYVSQTESMDFTLRPVWMPAMRIMVQMIVRTVRQRVEASAIFCVKEILTDQMRQKGIEMTGSGLC